MLVHTIDAIGPLDPADAAAARAAQAARAAARAMARAVARGTVSAAGANVLFAGDHGVRLAALGPVPEEATAYLVRDALDAGPVTVVDVGVAGPLPSRPDLVVRKVRAGTRDFTAEPALTADEVLAAVEIGIGTADNVVDGGATMLIAGGIGVGGAAAALALIAALTPQRWDDLNGVLDGRPDPDGSLARTLTAVRHGLARHRPHRADPLGALAAVGGLEHAALTGFILAAAAHRVPVVTGGPVGESAVALATALAPASAVVIVSEDWTDERVPGSRC